MDRRWVIVIAGMLVALFAGALVTVFLSILEPRVVDLVAGVAILLVVLMWWNGRRER